MTRYLVIVESPAKSKLIKKYLEKSFPQHEYYVEASLGHVRDLEKKELGVNLDTYDVKYVLANGKRDVVDRLRNLAGRSDMVLLASDNDREGEAIAWHVRDVLKLKAGKYKRMVFNEITESALKHAFNNLKTLDMDLVNAQQTRRIVDRIVGFKLSPLLWGIFKVENGTPLSAGRVQSTALKYIMDKEREVEEHVTEAYWSVKASFTTRRRVGAGGDLNIENCKLYDKKADALKRMESLKEVRTFFEKLKGQFKITGSRLHDSKASPDAPFITSTLQQEAAAKLGFSVKRTMGTAQALYERGYITYMRTDSFAISNMALDSIEKHIVKKYGKEFHHQRDYSSKRKVKNGQEAHEAIRPTDFEREILSGSGIDVGMKDLYELIHKRAVASQMRQSVHFVLDVIIKDSAMLNGARNKIGDLEFRGAFKVLKDPGYLVVWGEQVGDVAWLTKLSEDIDKVELSLVEMTGKNTWTGAPGRYNEAALIKVLERDGIGRPSTYGSILEKLYSKSYVALQNTEGVKHQNVDLVVSNGMKIREVKYESTSNAELNRMVPTEIGKRIHAYLEQHFPDIIDGEFTSEMESQLDQIAEGKAPWTNVLGGFWSRLRPRVEAVAKMSVRPKDKELLQVARDEYDVDGIKYVVRLGKYGPLIESHGVDQETGKKKKLYIGLAPYLRLVKKGYGELTEDEVRLMVSLPKNIGTSGAELRYGRYGFYVVDKGDNYMLPAKWVNQELGGWSQVGTLEPRHLPILVKMKEEYLKKKLVGTKSKKLNCVKLYKET